MEKVNNLKVLLYDVETKPVRCWLWRVGSKINVGHDQIVDGEKFDIITICFKWLGEKKIHSLDWGLKAQDSTKMIKEFTKVIESADLAIGHNGDRFDMLQINTQRLMHNQPPIAWPSTDDTLKQFRRYFAFPSYKLDYLAKVLTGSGKSPMSFQDWIDIVQYKKAKKLKKMIKYCKKDVLLLEKVYKRASKFFKPKVHAGLHAGIDGTSCPRCSSSNLQKYGFRHTLTGRYQRYVCNNCSQQIVSGRKS